MRPDCHQPDEFWSALGRARWAVLAALLSCAGLLSAETSPPVFKVYVEEDGAYRVAFEDLGLVDGELASDGMTLTAGGAPVRIWLEDGGDGLFGPGDWFEFVGQGLRGDVSYWSEHSRFNVYFLRFGGANPARMIVGAESTSGAAVPAPLRTGKHLEQDLMLLRIAPRKGVEREELWYWAKLGQNAAEPFEQELDLSGLEPAGDGAVDLRIHLRGWSKPRKKADPETPDHRVRVLLDGAEIGSGEWNGTDTYLLEIGALAAARFKAGRNVLRIEVPNRLGPEGEDLIDVVMLNWIEVDYPRRERIVADQARMRFEDESSGGALRLERADGRRLLVYGDKGSRWAKEPVAHVPPESSAAASEGDRSSTSHWVPLPGESSFHASAADRLMQPSAILRDKPSRLADALNRADYIILAHPRLIEAARPLAELHRARGLEVKVIDVEDVYDEFNHGVLDPRAIRDFLGYAYHEWSKPAPRFVLLVGDASWDARNARALDQNYADWTYRPGERLSFVKNGSTPYPTNSDLNHRGLIPTWNYSTFQGHAASDNFFVAVDGEDFLPDMAIGRLPVVEVEEVEAIVDKTRGYVAASATGVWRNNVLLITNESVGLQRQSDRLAGRVAALGLRPEKIYPASSEASNEHHSQRLLELFDEGQLVVHFLGHGGRYIWRTGPPDLKKNHDLFTLEHLDQLEPTDRLPIVLSLTCFSAPFDHPSADSIGEKFLRSEGRGAVSVVAASWRNTPGQRWGTSLIEELTAPGATVGEAVQRAKHVIGNRIFVETYNLLGDPAVPVATARSIALEVADTPGAPLRVSGTVELEDFSGSLLLELVGAEGEILASNRSELGSSVFDVELERPSAAVVAVRATASRADGRIDAVGGELLTAAREAARPGPRGRPARRPPAENASGGGP